MLQLLNFSIVPLHLQVPFAAGISAVWTVILSMMRGSCDDDAEAAVAADDAAAVRPRVLDWSHCAGSTLCGSCWPGIFNHARMRCDTSL